MSKHWRLSQYRNNNVRLLSKENNHLLLQLVTKMENTNQFTVRPFIQTVIEKFKLQSYKLIWNKAFIAWKLEPLWRMRSKRLQIDLEVNIVAIMIIW